MKYLLDLRSRLGPLYATRFENLDVPWKPISIGDFIHYDDLATQGKVPHYILEEEIFSKSVLDNRIKKDQELPAGIVPSTVQTIMLHSGPHGIDEFNQALNAARQKLRNVLHETITIVCRAFPAYTPEQVYAMDYETFMLRLAQAELVLMKAGGLSEPIELLSSDKIAQKQKKHIPADLRRIWESQMQQKDPAPPKRQSPVLDAMSRKKPPVVADETGKSAQIDFVKDRMVIDSDSSGWDKADIDIYAAKMVEDAKIIYKDLIEKMPYYQQDKESSQPSASVKPVPGIKSVKKKKGG